MALKTPCPVFKVARRAGRWYILVARLENTIAPGRRASDFASPVKDGAVPAIKDRSHDSELQMVSETASNVSVLLAIGAQVLVTL